MTETIGQPTTKLSRRQFLTGVAVVGATLALGGVKEAEAQNSTADYALFTREDFQKLGLVVAPQDVEQKWATEVHPEIATVKTKEGSLLGVEVSLPLALMDGGNEATVVIETAEGKGFATRGEDPSLNLQDYKDWFKPENPEQDAKEKIARLYLVDGNGSQELRKRIDRRGDDPYKNVYKNPGSAKNISLFAGSPWAAKETVMTVQTFNTSVMAKEGEAGGAVLNREPRKTFTANFKVSMG